MYIRDNLDLFEAYDAEQERQARKLPICKCCEQRIYQEEAVHVGKDWYCEECEDEAWERVKKEYVESIDV